MKLAHILFDKIFLNEFYRVKSFDSQQRLLKEGPKLASLGYYFSGVIREDRVPIAILKCAFCEHEFRLRQPLQRKPPYSLIEQDHKTVQKIDCIQKVGNIPKVQKLKPYNFFTTKSDAVYPMEELAQDSRKRILTIEELKEEDRKPFICPCCKKRMIDTVLLKCGCMVVCGHCLSDWAFETCFKCGASVVGYGNVKL